jgi:hypothetical protein
MPCVRLRRRLELNAHYRHCLTSALTRCGACDQSAPVDPLHDSRAGRIRVGATVRQRARALRALSTRTMRSSTMAFFLNGLSEKPPLTGEKITSFPNLVG